MRCCSFLCIIALLLQIMLSNRQFAQATDETVDCNENVCGSVVSKCLLTQSCQCKLSDCHCCKDCFNCMGDLFMECCSCLDLCPKHKETSGLIIPKSQIGDFEGFQELFDTLTVEEDEEQWTMLRFEMRTRLRNPFDMTQGGNFNILGTGKSSKNGGKGYNCTLIFLHTCTANRKCAQYCESMGARSYRWFHDGCCQCVGAHCMNYGLNESRCMSCPEEEETELAGLINEDYEGSEDDMMWQYGEDEKNYN